MAGHSVNIYNPHTLKRLAGLGLQRWVFPLELSAETLSAMQAERPAGLQTEVFAYGRMPLAYSARCFTARAHKLTKDDCQYRCLDYPDGLTLTTQDDNRFLALNGIQTQSARSVNLLGELPRLQELGVDVLRISPQANHTAKIVEAFAAALSGEEDHRQAATALKR